MSAWMSKTKGKLPPPAPPPPPLSSALEQAHALPGTPGHPDRVLLPPPEPGEAIGPVPGDDVTLEADISGQGQQS